MISSFYILATLRKQETVRFFGRFSKNLLLCSEIGIIINGYYLKLSRINTISFKDAIHELLGLV